MKMDGHYVDSVWYPRKTNRMNELWEILVPASNNKDLKFTHEHHKEWDAFVKDLTGGVTITKTAKGQWVSPEGNLYVDRVIPCRILCSKEQIMKIAEFTIKHYTQEAVMVAKISDDAFIVHKEKQVVPVPPLSRIIKEGTAGSCPKCGSTEIRWMGFGKVLGCIQPKCKNYYKKKPKKKKDNFSDLGLHSILEGG